MKVPKFTVTAGNSTPAGLYLFKLKDVEEVEGKDYRTGEPVQQLKWIWEVARVLELEPSEEQEARIGEEHWEWSSQVISARSKAVARAEALLGHKLAVGEGFDTDDLIDRYAKVVVEDYTRADGLPGTRVGSLAPYKGSAKTKKSAPLADDEEPTDEPPF